MNFEINIKSSELMYFFCSDLMHCVFSRFFFVEQGSGQPCIVDVETNVIFIDDISFVHLNGKIEENVLKNQFNFIKLSNIKHKTIFPSDIPFFSTFFIVSSPSFFQQNEKEIK